ncbi:MAG: hypothetical protein IT330_07765 [Anaerolineae bacterium]|nr:hypothetical protein [Anaerolineae bacterium]
MTETGLTGLPVTVILKVMERIKGFYQRLKTRVLAWVRPRGASRASVQEMAHQSAPSADAPRPSQEASAPARGGPPPAIQVKRPAEGWELWWPAGLAGLGIALTVLARWNRRRGGKSKEKT